MSLITLEYTDTLDSDNEKKVLEFSSDLLKEPFSKDSLFVIKVDGQSMEPVIKDRTLVVADLSQKTLEDNGVYLVYYDNRMWIKQVKQLEEENIFVSINEDYAHLVYKESEVRVIARAVLSFNAL